MNILGLSFLKNPNWKFHLSAYRRVRLGTVHHPRLLFSPSQMLQYLYSRLLLTSVPVSSAHLRCGRLHSQQEWIKGYSSHQLLSCDWLFRPSQCWFSWCLPSRFSRLLLFCMCWLHGSLPLPEALLHVLSLCCHSFYSFILLPGEVCNSLPSFVWPSSYDLHCFKR